MKCPKCSHDNEQDAEFCEMCGQRLSVVKAAIDSSDPTPPGFEVVLSTTDMNQIAFVKSVLQGENIPFHAQGDHFAAIRAPIPVRFLVPREHAQKAKQALKELL